METVKGKVEAVARESKNGHRGVKLGESWYSVPDSQFGQIQRGGIYEFAFEINGNFRNVKATKLVASPAAGITGTNKTKDKEIFVCAILKSFIEAGKIEPNKSALVKAGQTIASAYDEIFTTFAPKPVPVPPPVTPEAEFADEIPF